MYIYYIYIYPTNYYLYLFILNCPSYCQLLAKIARAESLEKKRIETEQKNVREENVREAYLATKHAERRFFFATQKHSVSTLRFPFSSTGLLREHSMLLPVVFDQYSDASPLGGGAVRYECVCVRERVCAGWL